MNKDRILTMAGDGGGDSSVTKPSGFGERVGVAARPRKHWLGLAKLSDASANR